VIINVTGGPEMSLMEVNEASCVIQEAAHEDANIIFGAVVDPNLGEKVKITVIATGFDKRPRQAVVTPTDFSNYTEYNAAQTAARVAAAQSSQAAVPQQTSSPQMTSAQTTTAQMPNFAPSLTVSRRAPIELSLPLAAAAGVGSGEHALELDSPLDVPAFLRRQN
jgi:cell division protein FtsZ